MRRYAEPVKGIADKATAVGRGVAPAGTYVKCVATSLELREPSDASLAGAGVRIWYAGMEGLKWSKAAGPVSGWAYAASGGLMVVSGGVMLYGYHAAGAIAGELVGVFLVANRVRLGAVADIQQRSGRVTAPVPNLIGIHRILSGGRSDLEHTLLDGFRDPALVSYCCWRSSPQ